MVPFSIRVMRGLIVAFCCLPVQVWAWNAMGHQLIAQIAWDQLNPETKALYLSYHRAVKDAAGRRSLVATAAWPDTFRGQRRIYFGPMHYIDQPFFKTKAGVFKVNRVNAIFAINRAIAILKSPTASPATKGFYLRLLIHVVADIHQPLHAISLISRKHPYGDRGGGAFRLGKNPIATNLHGYWDKGGGFLLSRQRGAARDLAARYPCSKEALDPQLWAQESYQLAKQEAYAIHERARPTKAYQRRVKQITAERIALAGCRLGWVLRSLSSQL